MDADTHLLLLDQQLDRVAVRDADDLVGEGVEGEGAKRGKYYGGRFHFGGERAAELPTSPRSLEFRNAASAGVHKVHN